MSYKVGSKVVCVNADFSTLIKEHPEFLDVFTQLPIENSVYTVRTSDEGAIRLEELINPECAINLGGVDVWEEPAFDSRRFAPLLENRDELTESMLDDILIDEQEYEYFEIEVEEDFGPGIIWN